MLIPHLEVMQREVKSTQDLINEDHNILVAESLIDLEVRLQLQNHIFESARIAWDHALAMINQVYKPFIEKYGLIPLIRPRE